MSVLTSAILFPRITNLAQAVHYDSAVVMKHERRFICRRGRQIVKTIGRRRRVQDIIRIITKYCVAAPFIFIE